MTDEEKILASSVTTALDRSDKAVIVSWALLSVGFVAINGAEVDKEIQLPANLVATSIDSAAMLLFVMHFINGIRYYFYLNRASRIAKLLPETLSNALASHPAFGTSNLITESLQTGGLTVLTSVVAFSAFEWESWLVLLVTLFVNLPFILGATRMLEKLNFRY